MFYLRLYVLLNHLGVNGLGALHPAQNRALLVANGVDAFHPVDLRGEFWFSRGDGLPDCLHQGGGVLAFELHASQGDKHVVQGGQERKQRKCPLALGTNVLGAVLVEFLVVENQPMNECQATW